MKSLSLALYVLTLMAVLGCDGKDTRQNPASMAQSDPFIDGGVSPDGSIRLVDEGVAPPPGMTENTDEVSPLPDIVEPPECGTPQSRGAAFIFGAPLEQKATVFDRIFQALNSLGHGLNADLKVLSIDAQMKIREFAESPHWSLGEQGLNADDLIASYGKAAGLYGGVGLAADAFRYAVLRDEGADCAAVERARAAVRNGLKMLDTAHRITGTVGVLPRALAVKGRPGDGSNPTTPLFDENDQPLPTEKNNGTWREDASGDFPQYIWEDSCSRDMYIGWVMAFAALWEVIRQDPSFTTDDKDTLRSTAHILLSSLKVVREEGYDLEIRDADGRRTYHGILNENSVDRTYIRGAPNAFNAIMAVGIVQALAYVSEHPADLDYAQSLVGTDRDLLGRAERFLFSFDLGPYTNFSGTNMAFLGLWLAMRYAPEADTRRQVQSITRIYYEGGAAGRPPAEQSQALYDLVYAASATGQSAFAPLDNPVEVTAIQSKVKTILEEFPSPPFFPQNVTNCDPQEIESTECFADDGTPLPLLGEVGWNDDLVADVPVPMRLRPHSNFYWRSNPYAVNGTADPLSLLPASDFRFVYWFGRMLRVAP